MLFELEFEPEAPLLGLEPEFEPDEPPSEFELEPLPPLEVSPLEESVPPLPVPPLVSVWPLLCDDPCPPPPFA